jgi:O-antigen chain-terminating methyltransferase
VTAEPPPQEHAIDVDRLVDELRERVARARRDGRYADDLEGLALDVPPPEPPVRFRPELAYSSKPGIGRPLTFVKQVILRLLVHVFDDLARQTSGAIEGARHAAEEGLRRESEERARLGRDIAALLARVEGIEHSLDHLQLGPRLARLERDRRHAAAGSAPNAGAVEPPALRQTGGAPLDYLAFEARFRGSEETIRERQRTYLDVLGDRRRVVDLGCGRGELVALLRESGVDAYGVEIEPDFVALLEERGVPAVAADAVAHLQGLAPGEVDAVILSHVVEHLPPGVLRGIIDTALEILPDGGLLVMETPNPESVVAGSVNFHRDPTHLRPVHPDTLAFMCESAGFADVSIRRLSPVPAGDRLPSPAPGAGPLAEHVDRVVGRLNDLLYGFQDYAVLARR